MNSCTPLLLCFALAAAADPPAEKRDAADRYAVRLAAAAAIEDVAGKTRAYLTIAVDAAEAGHADAVKKCLAACPKELDFGDQDEGFYSLYVRLAAAGNEAEALEAAKNLPRGVYRDKTLGQIAAGPHGGVAEFWRACDEGKDDRAAALLASVSPNAKDRDGETGLMKAAANGHVAVIKKLLAQDKTELWETDAKGQTALMKAAANGRDEVVRLLLEYYANKVYPKEGPLNVADGKGQTALMLAAAGGHANVVRVLLDVHFNSDANDPLGQKHFLTIDPEAGPAILSPFDAPLVDRERKDNEGKTAFDLAQAGKRAAVVELLKKGAP
jgi:hypothetical protein